jgi:hypothetical protein
MPGRPDPARAVPGLACLQQAFPRRKVARTAIPSVPPAPGFDNSPPPLVDPGRCPRSPDMPCKTQWQAQIPALMLKHLSPRADWACASQDFSNGWEAEFRQSGLRHFRATN